MSASLTLSANETVNYLISVFFEHGDQRTKNWLLSNSPWPLFAILAVYLLFCLYAGPRYMRDRKPYELKNTMIIYNAIQVIISCGLFYEFYQAGWGTSYNYKCAPLTYDTDPNSMRMARAVWLFYMAKITELLDTVFFVLRKKDRQISFLHVFHHFSMPLGLYFAVQNYAGGHGTIVCFINSFVHIVMYIYYMLTAMGPKVQKYLWWKKYITVLQLLQFSIVFVHSIQVQIRRNCLYPKGVAAIITLYSCIFSYMFGSFYVENYLKKNKKGSLKKD
ncbi:very long chain fatty acid elongase 7-like [Musca autumnalis]|uniref:very long chain fatty acid elongase 7-like n=1 Tax=Musca autumnalis TaxID=221902 RepID=UPI003CE7C8BA